MEIATLYGHLDCVKNILLNSDETKLFSCSRDKTIRIWDISEFIEIPIKSANKIF